MTGVGDMSNSKQISSNQDANAAVVGAEKRVILSMGGKGGVGKTSVMAGLAEWFEENAIPVKLLDLDTENKARGSPKSFATNTANEAGNATKPSRSSRKRMAGHR